MSWRSHNDHWSAPCFTAPESTVWWGHSAQTHFANQWGASHQTAEMHPFHYWALTWPNLLEILPCFVSSLCKRTKEGMKLEQKNVLTVYCFPFCLVLVQWWQAADLRAGTMLPQPLVIFRPRAEGGYIGKIIGTNGTLQPINYIWMLKYNSQFHVVHTLICNMLMFQFEIRIRH